MRPPVARVGGPVGRLVVVGDIHGRLDLLEQILIATGLASGGRWTGGDAVLLQVGDLLDRGPSGLRCLELMARLGAGAERAGGRAISVLGNHELMALGSTPAGGGHYRRMWVRNGAGAVYAEWLQQHGLAPSPSTARAFYRDFAPGGRYGGLILDRPLAAVVDGVLATHAGCDTINTGIEQQAAAAASVLAGLPGTGGQLADMDDSIMGRPGFFWTRGLDQAGVEAVCRREGVDLQVHGHTPGFGWRGHALNVDCGLVYGGSWKVAIREQGRWSALTAAGPGLLDPPT